MVAQLRVRARLLGRPDPVFIVGGEITIGNGLNFEVEPLAELITAEECGRLAHISQVMRATRPR